MITEKRNNTLIVLAGPTTSGKTGCGISLAKRYNTEIISADSRQIYRETTIGTAVPYPEELRAVKHHFIQTISVKQYYNASLYEGEVLGLLNELFINYPVVIMVGGSGLYIDAVCTGIDDLPPVDNEIRTELANRLKYEGLEKLADELRRMDPVSYKKTDLRNPMRVLKALEVTMQTGRPYSSFLSKEDKPRDFTIIRLALDPGRNKLYSFINRRVDRMMERGLLDEAAQLQPLRHYNALKTVGYRELFRYLDREISLPDAVEQIKNNTRKYARKQLTWFRKNNLYRWFHPSELDEMTGYINDCLRKSAKGT